MSPTGYPSYGPSQHEFRPQRWDPGSPDYRKPAPHEFIPFSGGLHRCIGAVMATTEMTVMLARLVARTRLRLPAQRIRAANLAALSPHAGPDRRASPLSASAIARVRSRIPGPSRPSARGFRRAAVWRWCRAGCAAPRPTRGWRSRPASARSARGPPGGSSRLLPIALMTLGPPGWATQASMSSLVNPCAPRNRRRRRPGAAR